LYGVWFLATQLESLSRITIQDLNLLINEYPESWKKSAKMNLESWLKNATIDEVKILEKQDPEGKLKGIVFKKFIYEDLWI
jgi:hypothetical protein